jgi:error-prone DNA polymerase
VALQRLAEADAFGGIGLDRRQALWAISGLADAALPLFVDADRGRAPAPEVPALEMIEPPVALVPMTDGGEVVEDYRTVGLSLRHHPVAFLRGALRARRMIACADLPNARDGRRVAVPGIVLVRQRPGSAKGVMFITIEDETGVANLVIWPSVFEQQRRVILSAGMIACHGRVQREGTVIHVIADRLDDLSDLLQSVGARAAPLPLRTGRGDEATGNGGPDPRVAGGCRPRDILVPALRTTAGIRVPTRDFR